MNKYFKAAGLATGIMLLAATSASAATVALTAEAAGVDVTTVPGQDFISDLQGVGANTLFSGPLELIASGPLRLTFSLVAAESGFNNALLFDGVVHIQENVGNGSVDFATGVLNGQTFSTTIAAGGNFAPLLSFDINGDGVADFFSSDDEFGVFADARNLSALTRFYLALDDSGANNDDNHDDIIVRVDVAPIPLPAGGLLLLTALGGMAVVRRRRKAA
jgi:hypothetical protein